MNVSIPKILSSRFLKEGISGIIHAVRGVFVSHKAEATAGLSSSVSESSSAPMISCSWINQKLVHQRIWPTWDHSRCERCRKLMWLTSSKSFSLSLAIHVFQSSRLPLVKTIWYANGLLQLFCALMAPTGGDRPVSSVTLSSKTSCPAQICVALLWGLMQRVKELWFSMS